ncbi:MAG: hypothetical protein KBA85_18815, partial [Chloroflexi bacterium]|nr:hypothetical protein [Chloroflexota bacterium]
MWTTNCSCLARLPFTSAQNLLNHYLRTAQPDTVIIKAMKKWPFCFIALFMFLTACGQTAAEIAAPPTAEPTIPPTAVANLIQPTRSPTRPSPAPPTAQPTSQPTDQPTSQPTIEPTSQPSILAGRTDEGAFFLGSPDASVTM